MKKPTSNRSSKSRAPQPATIDVGGQTVRANCMRCARRYRAFTKEAERWNVDYRSGFIMGLLCPGCQTVEENLEAEINLIDLKRSKVAKFKSLSNWKQPELIVQAIDQQVARVVRQHRDNAQALGETHLLVDIQGWAREAVDEWPGSKGQPQAGLETAYAVAEDMIREILDRSRGAAAV